MDGSVALRHRGRWAPRLLPVALVVVVVLSGNAVALPLGPGPPPAGVTGLLSPVSVAPAAHGTNPVNISLSVNTTSVNLSSAFWGTTVNNEVRMFRGETNAVNATPARVLVWPGAMAGEDYDPFTDTHYDTYSGSPVHALTGETDFVRLCEATHCIAIMQVPAEIDNATFAARIVNYTENTLGFHPAYWMIGNEPELWGHWQIPWKDWGSQYSTGPTPTQFGDEVVDYVKAIRAIDNTTPILGLPASGCTCGSWTFAQWIAGVLKVTGNKIQAVAFHEYPAGWLGTGDGSLEDFYATIQSAASIPQRMVSARAAVTSTCPDCNVSVFISELGAALSWSAYGPYSLGLSGALSIASQITQAMDDNLTNVDLFATELATTNSWFSTAGHARPDYTLYTQIFDHLGTQAFPVELPGLGGTLYGIDTIAPNDQGRRDLMVVNDNITEAINFTPKFAESPGTTPVEVWSWNGSIHTDRGGNGTTWVEPFTTTPVAHAFPDGLPANYTLPPQSLVLFETYPSGGTYVNVAESGVPLPTAWYARVGGAFHETTASNLSLLLPAGSYPVGSAGIPLPIGGREYVPTEQLGPKVVTPFVVAGRYSNVTIDFASQWRVNATPFPAGAGTVTPDVGWWDPGSPLNLSVTSQSPGYAFVGWTGWGNGSVNGTGRTITVVPVGPVVEKARFVVANAVDLQEVGLPRGTPWSVTVRGFTTNSTSSDLAVYTPNGTWAFTVQTIPGYRTIPRQGAFTVNGGPGSAVVRFAPITPPQPEYSVGFQVLGLPTPMAITITVRNSSLIGEGFAPVFQLINGSYAYRVGYVPGYHLVGPGTFTVGGGPTTVDVTFAQTLYRATWLADGLRSGTNWTLEIAGDPVQPNSSWVSLNLPNGTYPYRVGASPDFSITPRSGVLVVDGNQTGLALLFSLVMFPATFLASGPSAASGWSIRLGSLTQGAWASRSSFLTANGTYTFDVHPPNGYYAIPSHGNLTVAGTPAPVLIRFFLVSERPSAALVAALSAGALSVSIWIGLAGLVGFVVVRGLRRRGG